MSTQYEKSDSKPPPGSCLYDLLYSETPCWDRPGDAETITSWFLRKERKPSGAQARLERMLEEFGNSVCADCGSPDPKWVLSKPRPDSSIEERSDFIRRKYEMQQFLEGNEQSNCLHQPHHRTYSSTLRNTSNNHFSNKKHREKPSKHRIGQKFRNSRVRKDTDQLKSKKSNSLAGMVEFVGLIRVNVVKGTNLAARDMLSSDPYVILALGQQSLKTRVIRNNLNPIWNKSLMLSIPENISPLKVLVYDKDTFKADDFMGDAEIDIQPLVVAAKAYEKSEIN
ncbi:putative ADP-ribosylation factor GTPase-activating protein AGD11 [Hibiscus syriacus]|uniref:ADP-ribosylation factor GTPase-activating protein AGD11 n=1 Tax=Hibiscus syriacus TaxID=106335 RepID=A0A6A2YS44_HIBSY|nr:putative ADP-ribosylation factor GTPase-activating protein AGD11 [Hibiscus syriacus]